MSGLPDMRHLSGGWLGASEMRRGFPSPGGPSRIILMRRPRVTEGPTGGGKLASPGVPVAAEALKTVEKRPFNPRGENGSPERSVHPNSGLPEFGINKVIEVG